MRHEFNQNMMGARLVPPTPKGLADRIIAKAQYRPVEGNIFMMFILPRPFMVVTLLFVLSFVAGIGLDLGFNSIDNLMLNQQDILYDIDNTIYVDTL